MFVFDLEDIVVVPLLVYVLAAAAAVVAVITSPFYYCCFLRFASPSSSYCSSSSFTFTSASPCLQYSFVPVTWSSASRFSSSYDDGPSTVNNDDANLCSSY